ncbi:MAG: excinuclease ABC subunit UvrA, partial [Bacteroidota bacterium]|nr:excinuclease ABC subunit UvrA [Bacteroidota bacterium]
MNQTSSIQLVNVSQNNLKNISLQIPRNKLVVVTGVSGSGKSSLAFDVINAEGQRQYFVNLSAQARKYLGKLNKPNVEQIKNLTPTISVSQNIRNNNPRSTVGTLTDVYDFLRLLFARIGKTNNKDIEINRSLFSFNSTTGMCSNCKGLGVEDKISIDLLVEDENKTIRNQALKITNPNAYTIYSQVTIDALNKVCNAYNFNVDIPWKDLTDEQKHIILYGSDKVIIPYGKHPLESRMKWSGITAKPRPEGFYKGIIPVMEEILNRDRNPNILRFAKTQQCSKCGGSRLCETAQSVKIDNKNIYDYSKLSLDDLKIELTENKELNNNQIAKAIIFEILKRISILQDLGLGYLSLNRQATELSGGELQRIRLARQVGSELRNITFIFDEPSIGVHPSNNKNILKVIRKVVDNGNTVIVVEHDSQTILSADWIIDIGPKAGINGGEVLFNGSAEKFLKSKYKSLT